MSDMGWWSDEARAERSAEREQERQAENDGFYDAWADHGYDPGHAGHDDREDAYRYGYERFGA